MKKSVLPRLMKKRQSAFTLLEIMLVISIIVVLLGVAINKLVGNIDVAKSTRVQADIQAIGTQLKLYESLNGAPPTTEQGLQALVTQPSSDPRPQRWHQLLKEIPKDPWSNYYIYLCPGRKNSTGYDLYSVGKDRKADTADDDWGG
jgi:general secretion pathway protein G